MCSFYDLSTYAVFLDFGTLSVINMTWGNAFNAKPSIIKHNHLALCYFILGVHMQFKFTHACASLEIVLHF